MQQILRIEKILPLRDRNYTDRNGQPQVFTSQGFLLGDGVNRYYMETTGNYAKAVQGLKLKEGATVTVQFVADARQWTTQQGEERYENTFTISNIGVMWE